MLNLVCIILLVVLLAWFIVDSGVYGSLSLQCVWVMVRCYGHLCVDEFSCNEMLVLVFVLMVLMLIGG